MTAPILMTDCPTEETLAAYVDDRLDEVSRGKVTEHLASCGECREIMLMATDYQETEANVRRGTFGNRPWLPVAAGLAAAAALAFFVLQSALVGPDLGDVIEASRTLSHRPSEGRLSGGFPYRQQAPTFRGEVESSSESMALGERAKLFVIATKLQDAKFADAHAVAVTDLLLATKKDGFNHAVAALEIAYAKEKGDRRDAIAVDLAAALIARARWNQTEKDYERALDLSNEVLKRKQIPEAAWNRAVALELLNRDAEAIRAWDEYLKLDPSSDWAKDATDRKARLIQRDF